MIKQILVVDDDEEDCDLFVDAVKMINADIICEKLFTATSALERLRSDYKPDYIFLDLNMPMVDGKNCLIEIRKMQSLDRTPVIVYTTSKREDDKVKTKELGASYFITKPSSLTELCGEISYVLLNKWNGKNS